MKQIPLLTRVGVSIVCLSIAALASCTFSVTPVWNANKSNVPETKATPTQIQGRDDLKAKALRQVETLHKLMNEAKYEAVYEMIDDDSQLKLPKDQAIANMKEVEELGKFQKMEMTRDIVVEDKSLHDGQLQIRQEFIVTYEKDTPTPKRYELFNWNVYPGDKIKLWSFINSKGTD
jgi:hypothetical protein